MLRLMLIGNDGLTGFISVSKECGIKELNEIREKYNCKIEFNFLGNDEQKYITIKMN